ncbi:hypothetical protein [Actinoplanes siamensis]|uniref:hypothetical protein n=1 Tax=Actinoplanes siamensis TaxID=1223317 RepID=UPI001942F3C1|nr:hypothetical protein [Actinoplanes siamensis]
MVQIPAASVEVISAFSSARPIPRPGELRCAACAKLGRPNQQVWPPSEQDSV